MKVEKVTAEMLRRKGAACPALTRFQAEWPDGAEVTLANLLRAAELNLNLFWWENHFLPDPLRAEFERQMAPLWAELDHPAAPLQAEQVAPLRAEFTCHMAPPWAELGGQAARLIWQLLEALGQQAPA